jgi:hypothetical protein
MSRVIALFIAVVSLLGVPVVNSKQPDQAGLQKQSNDHVAGDQDTMHLAIAAVDSVLKPTDHYRVGEQVIVAISMTNTTSQPRYVCVSSDLYQDRPMLTRNDRLLPYTEWENELLVNVQNDQTCQRNDLPQWVQLKVNVPTVVDFQTIVDDSQFPTGAQPWYGPLAAGTYELTIQRRLSCCNGPMIESNKISFEVDP